MVAKGEDPVEAKREARTIGATFADVAADYMQVKSRTYRNANSAKNDRLLLMTHAAALAPMPIASIGTTHVNAALRPLWLRSPDLARRAQAVVLRVIRYGKAQGLGVTSAGEMRDDLKVLLPTVKN
jgi:hypothetical protein